MLTSLIPVIIALTPLALSIFIIYYFFSRKAGKIIGLVLGGGIFLLLIVVFVFLGPSSKTKNAVTLAGEKAISEVVQKNYPSAQYSVEGKIVTFSDETHNSYRVNITTEYNEASYIKFNKEVCTRLGDSSASLLTKILKGGLSQGKGGACSYWLGIK